MPQRAGEDHHLLLLARAGVPSGEQLTGRLSPFRFGPGAQAGPYPKLPSPRDCFLDRPDLQRTGRTPRSG